jgi:glycosyltransferase involved in cell wall biosynthesis
MPHQRKFGVFVIAYNAECHIAQTLDRIPPNIWNQIEEVFLVDDCSTDETVSMALRLADKYPKLKILRNRTNQRYGGNQKVGFQYAIDRGLDMVVMLHADGQYAPEILPQMIEPLMENRADIVLGSRMIHKADALKGGMPRYKFIGNIVLTRVQNFLSGMNLHEFHTGYRAYSVEFLKSIPFWDNTDEWHFDTEILLQGQARQARIVEIPIPTYYGDEICHVNGIAYGFNCIRTSLRHALHRFGIYYSRNFDLKASGSRYSSKFHDPYSSHTLLHGRLARQDIAGKTVLELGVGDCSLTKRLHSMGARIDCIELDSAAAKEAEPFARQVWNESISITQLDDIGEQYDLVIAADILEHLLFPEEILSKLKTCVKKGGGLLVSLPNIANVYVRINLLFGRFPYHTKGILDSSHLHFYTRRSAERMLTKTGWEIVERDYSSIPVAVVFPFLQKPLFRPLLHALRGATLLFNRLFCYQFLLYCRNPNESHLL